MDISIIVAMDENRGIGLRGRLPWRLQADLRRFKALTMGHHIIMGRKTFESIGRMLKGRTMIVVTRSQDYRPEGPHIAHSLEDALDLARTGGEEEVFIIGGEAIFSQALPLAGRIYLTQVHTQGETDVSFPDYDPRDWREVAREHQPADEHNDFPFTYRVLVKSEE